MEFDLPILGATFAILVLVALSSTIKIVPQGYHWTIERFGRYTKTLTPGLNIVLPFIDRVGRKSI